MECYFCKKTQGVTANPEEEDSISYRCPRCGPVRLHKDACQYISEPTHLPENDRRIISICLRNIFERRGPEGSNKILTFPNLKQIVTTYRENDAIEKIEIALLNIDSKCKFFGDYISVNLENDYPYYHCFEQKELHPLLVMLLESGFIESEYISADHIYQRQTIHEKLCITPKGYERIRELKKTGKDSRQCFVAMWLEDEMLTVYEIAIKPAIEYKEEGQKESRFKALIIGEKEHTNDINDEIISEIRRSRFMVCDLTGYRGGVYWEAGFAYGLGLEVIYTCREDWIKKIKKEIKNESGKIHPIIQQGIHFDLEHRNRIEWKNDTKDDLSKFEKDLRDRIKAVIT